MNSTEENKFIDNVLCEKIDEIVKDYSLLEYQFNIIIIFGMITKNGTQEKFIEKIIDNLKPSDENPLRVIFIFDIFISFALFSIICKSTYCTYFGFIKLKLKSNFNNFTYS
jgi:hypothetical protein